MGGILAVAGMTVKAGLTVKAGIVMKILILFTLLFLPSLALANLCETKAFATRSAGSQVVDMANRFLSKIGISKPLKPNGEGKDSPSAYIRDPSIVGIETYSSALLRETKLWLQREITPQEVEAIEKANSLKTSDEGTQSSAINTKDIELLTHSHNETPQSSATNLKAKAEILKTAGFSKAEIQKLMESGIVWIRNLSPQEALLKNLREGKENIYFRSTLRSMGQPSRILKVEKETDEGFEVLAEVLSDNGFLTTEKVIIQKDSERGITHQHGTIYHGAIHSDTQVLFAGVKSQKSKVHREDIKLPAPTQQEKTLQEQGFGPAWTKGLDKLNEWVAVRKQLQDLKVHPRTTHIPYFSDQIELHLTFAREALGTTFSKQQKKALVNLMKEARKTISKEKVTYDWWLSFNLQLSYLLSPLTSKDKDYDVGSYLKTKSPFNVGIETIPITQFPLQMAVPTIKGELGIITFNRAQSEGIYPLGLISRSKEVDGEDMTPIKFIDHDIGHMDSNLSEVMEHHSSHYRLKHKKMLGLMENLPTEKRKQAELVYFVLTHEQDRVEGTKNILFTDQSRQEILDEMARLFNYALTVAISLEMAGLGKEYSDLKSEVGQIQYIKEHIIEPFMREVYDPAF